MEGGVEEEKEYTYALASAHWPVIPSPAGRRYAARGRRGRHGQRVQADPRRGASSRLAGAELIPSRSGGNEQSEPSEDGRGRRACGAGLGCGADSQRVSRRGGSAASGIHHGSHNVMNDVFTERDHC